MDLFQMVGIEVEDTTHSASSSNAKGKSSKSSQKKPTGKSSDKQIKTKPAAAKRYQTQEDIRNMPIPLRGWSVHYAAHKFDVEQQARLLVDMSDSSYTEEQVREALWALISEDIKKDIGEARRQAQMKTESETLLPADDQDPNAATTEGSPTVQQADPSGDADDLEVDEETGIVGEKKAAEADEPEPKQELMDGDLTIAMIGQALAYEYHEFATPEAVSWRVDKENKALIPAITNGKWGMPDTYTKGFYWFLSDMRKAERPKPISIIAGCDGHLYECRENPFMQVVRPAARIRELNDVQPGVQLNAPRFPGVFLAQTIAFFKRLAEESREAVVYIVMNKADKSYELHCPVQQASETLVTAEFPIYGEDKLIVAKIHSHHRYPAEFSRVDNANDQAMCVYGIIGKLHQVPIDLRFRAGYNGVHYYVPVIQLFDLDPMSSYSSDFPLEWLDRVERV